ncbi:pyrimidine 5'-nucleotidase [Zavarzinia compransoris]|uniref:pyrimidine 5'-nucleotidase n=1 Tax=Zavarzinia marina TaxID=2911065 RepID=UPI001F288959|nr:pyrimidine 5'-nucleotidase [Zavarzinia marina]MCF4165842.1 pyrimidine 5'-nucleotidase [Zavarzinia marina]
MFDLDNTLYPASCRLFDQIEARMREFIRHHLAMDDGAAGALKRELFQRHGTTMKGLVEEHGVDPHQFLRFVHEIDLGPLDAAPRLDDVLAALPGRKVIFTNGSRRHAERVVARLGIERHFDGIFDIVAANFVPKPEPVPYADMIAALDFDPRRATMVEDMARNLKPAADLGMATVWIPNGTDWGAQGGGDHVHHVAEDLAAFLAGHA